MFEEPLSQTSKEPDEKQLETVARLQSVIRDYQSTVQRQLEQIRQPGLSECGESKTATSWSERGEARQDIESRPKPRRARLFTQRAHQSGRFCAAFLVDLSASTDDPITPPEPRDWSDYDPDKEVDLRAGWYSALEIEDEEPTEPERKIIDLEQEAMVVMAAALDALGDHYGVYGFSGYGKDCVEIFVAKEMDDSFHTKLYTTLPPCVPKVQLAWGQRYAIAVRNSWPRVTP